MLSRPLPPFRVKPSRKTLVPKTSASESRKDEGAVAVKAQRHPIKLARLNTPPSLKILKTATMASA